MSTQSAQRAIHDLLDKPYEIETVIAAALTTFERSMARNPRELIIETILEGYRHEHRILADGSAPDVDADMFTELFARAKADGKLGTLDDRRGAPRLPGPDPGQRGRPALGGRRVRQSVVRRGRHR